MVDIGRARIATDQDLMRNISYAFDTNTNTIAGVSFAVGSSGIPIEVLESKRKLFASILQAPIFAGAIESFEQLDQENAQLQTENYILKQRIWAIEERLANIEATIPKEEVIVLREISRDEAKAEIERLFAEGGTLYYSDIAKKLCIDLELVVDVCEELFKEGKVRIAEASQKSR